jgi:hypothetical protein
MVAEVSPEERKLVSILVVGTVNPASAPSVYVAL